ncbi:MAG: hypothetical protein ACD_21C00189G0015 [uncultured bacterium]|nr:MAG: hypothetical protein ACD_21C00189G0015 [uncultured bacterium]
MSTKPSIKVCGSGEDIVLLHGWAMHSGVWVDMAKQLAQSHRVTLLDLPGFGDSDLVFGGYELEDIAQQIFAIIPAKAIWMGWSMGGLIAMWIAIHHPEAVKKLILVSSSPCFIEKPNWPGINPGVFDQFDVSLKKDVQHAILRFLNLQLGENQYVARQKHLRQLKALMFAKKLPTIDALIGGLDLLRNIDMRPQLFAIKCPVLFILGEVDRLVPASIDETLNAYIPQALIGVIPQAAHVPFFSHAQIFLEMVKRFLHAK